MEIINILIEYSPAFFTGLMTTLKLCLLTWSIGLILGGCLGYARHKNKIVNYIAGAITIVIFGVPILVLLFWMYFPLLDFTGISINSFWLATICFSMINTTFVGDIVFQGLDSLPKQYVLAAKICGMDTTETFLKIQLPLVFRYVIGPILLVQLVMLHSTIFASLINVNEIFRQIQRVNAIVYKPVELYSILAFFFMMISIPLYLFANYLKKKYSSIYSQRI